MMKKTGQINIQKNMKNGKMQGNSTKLNQEYYTHQQINKDKKQQKNHKKVLSQHKLNIPKVSTQKQSIKSNRSNHSSVKKNNMNKLQKNKESPSSSKKSIKSSNSEHDNLINSKRNIYTAVIEKPKQKPIKNQRDNKQSDRIQLQKLQTCGSLNESLTEQFQRLDVQDLVGSIQGYEFSHIHSLKLKVLNFIFKNRIVKDEQYDRLFSLMTEKFPEKQEIFRSILFEIVSSLDN